MAVIGSHLGGSSTFQSRYTTMDGSPLEELNELASGASKLLTDALKSGGGSTQQQQQPRSGGTAVAIPGGGFNPQAILQAEDSLRQRGMKTCLGIIKDASGNIVGVSPRQIKLEENCPAGAVDATTFASSGGIAGGAGLTPSPSPAPSEIYAPSGEGMMTGGGPAAPVPWYKKWWVWALIVGGTATVGVGGYLIYRRQKAAVSDWDDSSDWDDV